ncbi:MAG: hypothetical protein WCV93_00350 [Candidatus Shapirobacteria bacterium]|jgi:hypothetical protein
MEKDKQRNWFLSHKIVSGIILFIILMMIIGAKNRDTQKGFQDGVNTATKTLETSSRSLEEKQEIFTKIAQAEDRAMKEAEEKYPTSLNHIDAEQAKKNVEPNAELVQELEEKYRQEILNEYNVSKDEWSKIGIEGVKDNWPISVISPTVAPTKTNSVTSKTNSPTTNGTSGYQTIYNKYVAKLKAECPTLSTTECAQISNEGVSEMVKHMYTSKGTEGQYQTYSDWAAKLMDIYIKEAR